MLSRLSGRSERASSELPFLSFGLALALVVVALSALIGCYYSRTSFSITKKCSASKKRRRAREEERERRKKREEEEEKEKIPFQVLERELSVFLDLYFKRCETKLRELKVFSDNGYGGGGEAAAAGDDRETDFSLDFEGERGFVCTNRRGRGKLCLLDVLARAPDGGSWSGGGGGGQEHVDDSKVENAVAKRRRRLEKLFARVLSAQLLQSATRQNVPNVSSFSNAVVREEEERSDDSTSAFEFVEDNTSLSAALEKEEACASKSGGESTETLVAANVSTLTKALGLDISEMDTGTKLQLIQTAVQCVNTETQSKQVQLSARNLHLQKERNKFAEKEHELNVSEAKRRSLSQDLQDFKASCADSLVAGILVMVLCMVARIFNVNEQWSTAVETCSEVAVVVGGGGASAVYSYYPYALLSVFVGKAICSIKVLLAKAGGYLLVGYISAKGFHYLASLSVSYQKAPVTVMLLLMGLLLGNVLKSCVLHTGGNSVLFLALWTLLCCTHCMLVTKAEAALTWLQGGRGHNKHLGDVDNDEDKVVMLQWRSPLMHLFLIVVLPVATGYLPYAYA